MSTQKVIYINSKNRTAGTNEDFTISKVVEEFRRPPKTVKLLSACVPYSWNNLLEGTELTITEDGLAPFVVALDPGFYTGLTLASALEVAIEAGSAQNYTVVFNQTTNKMTISTDGVLGFSITIDNEASASFFGFPVGTTAGYVFSIESTYPLQLLIDYEVFICSDLVRGSDNGIIPWNGNPPPPYTDQNQILARVPINSCFNSVIAFTNSPSAPFFITTQSNYASEGGERSLRFFLRFPSGAPVDLNGYHWTAEILFDFGDN